MKENIYVIYDRGANIALKPPMVHRNDVAPVREFTQAAQNSESYISKHPREFELIQVGELDLETLEITPVDPRLVATAVDLIPPAT